MMRAHTPGRTLPLSGIVLVLCALVLLSTPHGAWAETLYSFVDEHGVRHFTNAPVDQRYQPMSSMRTPVMPDNGVAAGGGGTRRSYRPIPPLYDSYAVRAGSLYGVNPNLIRAVMQVESSCNRYAVSRSGARGLMQLMPVTAGVVRVRNSFDPWENIRGGTEYLRAMLDRFGGNLGLALAAYNAGPTLVDSLGAIPAIPETQDYVREVLALFRTYEARSRGMAVRVADTRSE